MTLKNFPISLLFEEKTPEQIEQDRIEADRLENEGKDIKDHPYVKRQRDELARLRQEKKDRDTADSDAEKKKLKDDNELDKLNKKLQKELEDNKTKFESDLSARDLKVVNAEIKVIARDMGARPEVLAKITKFLDFDTIELDDEGEVTGVEDQMKKLKEEMPFLFGETEEDKGTGGGPAPRRPARGGGGGSAREDFRDAKKHDRASVDAGWKSLIMK